MPGCLYIVSTPIGNLEDITYRAVRILKEVDWIACEDTRTTGHLLHHYGITTKTVSYHEHNEAQRAPEIFARLQAGESVALVSDAGTPLLSDPGFRIVRGAAHFGVRIESFAHEQATLIFYEAPHRIVECLHDIATALGARDVCVGRELTKLHEEVLRGTATEIAAQLESRGSIRGEFVVLVGKGDVPVATELPVEEAITLLMEAGIPRMDAIKTVAKERGLSKREVYKLVSIKDAE